MSYLIGKLVKHVLKKAEMGVPTMLVVNFTEKGEYLCRYWSNSRGHFIDEMFKREELIVLDDKNA